MGSFLNLHKGAVFISYISGKALGDISAEDDANLARRSWQKVNDFDKAA